MVENDSTLNLRRVSIFAGNGGGNDHQIYRNCGVTCRVVYLCQRPWRRLPEEFAAGAVLP